MSAGAPPPSAIDPIGEVTVALGPPRDDARLARRERIAVLVRSKSFIAGAIIVGFWLLCAILGKAVVLQDPFASSPINGLASPSAVPSTVPRSVAAGAMIMMSREPTMTRENTSRPIWSVPNQCSAEGGVSELTMSSASGS